MMENVQMRLSSRASSHHHTQLYTTDFTLIMEGREQDPVHSSRPPSPPQAQCWGFAFSFWSVWSLLAHLLLVGNVLLRGTHNHGLLSTSGHCDLLSKHLRHRDQPKYGLFSNNLASETDICLERCKYALDVLPDLCLEEKVASCLWEEAEKGILLRGFQLKCQLFSRCAHLSARCLRKPGVGPSSAASNRKHHYILILCRSAKGCIVKKKKDIVNTCHIKSSRWIFYSGKVQDLLLGRESEPVCAGVWKATKRELISSVWEVGI